MCSGDDCCAYMHTGSELGPDISGIGVKASVSVFQTEGVGSIPTCRSNLLQYSNLGREDGMRVRTVQVRVLSGAPLVIRNPPLRGPPCDKHVAVVQQEEHRLAKSKVTGSRPVCHSTIGA